MKPRVLMAIVAFATVTGQGSAQSLQRRAEITGGGNSDRGKCTIEVLVDGAVDVEIRGENAALRNLNGQQPQWRRFQCTSPMPANPGDFRFTGVDGRGRQELVRDPRNGGVAIVHIEDPAGGAEGYTFDLTWSGGTGFQSNQGQFGQDRTSQDRFGQDNRGNFPQRNRDGNFGRSFSQEQAAGLCQDAVRQQASERFRTSEVAFRGLSMDTNPGRREWMTGVMDVRRGFARPETYRFSCALDFNRGLVRTVQIDPLDSGRGLGSADGDRVTANTRAMESCQRAIQQRLRSNGYENVDFGSINLDNRPGREDSIAGDARGFNRDGRADFDFSCSVNLDSGVVRSIDVRRR